MTSIETKPIAESGNEATFSRREIIFPKSTWLRYPNQIYDRFADRKINPRISAVQAIQLGSLADMGHVSQEVTGVEPIRLAVSDFPPYPVQFGNSRALFSLDLETATFIGKHSDLLTGDRRGKVGVEKVRDWFQRTITFRERFMEHAETRELIRLSVGYVYMPLSAENLEKTWVAAGLPQLHTPTSQYSHLSIVHREGVVGIQK